MKTGRCCRQLQTFPAVSLSTPHSKDTCPLKTSILLIVILPTALPQDVYSITYDSATDLMSLVKVTSSFISINSTDWTWELS
jgi:hypothetical protein